MSNTIANTVLVDWGTSNFRAYLLDENGSCISRLNSGLGIKKITHETCVSTLQNNIDDWLENHVIKDILMAGMVGSALGWCSVPLLPAPCNVDAIAKALHKVDFMEGIRAHIIPGVASRDEHGNVTGIMRGEEVQILGGLSLIGETDVTICLPGSHSKWVNVTNSNISSIRTFMTGELFDLVRHQSILSTCMEDSGNEMDVSAFRDGVQQAKSGQNLLESLFTIRSEFVANPNQTHTQRLSHASGIMIGSELHAALRQTNVSHSNRVLVICSKNLAKPYTLAFDVFNKNAEIVDGEDAFICGCNLLRTSSLLTTVS